MSYVLNIILSFMRGMIISTLVLAIVLHDARISAFAPLHGVAVRGITTTTSSLKSVRCQAVAAFLPAGRIPWQKLVVTRVQVKEWLSIMRAETHVLDIVTVVFLSLFLNKVGGFL